MVTEYGAALSGREIHGLSSHEVSRSRIKNGANEITQKKKHGFFLKFVSSFGDPIIIILLAALFINLIFAIRGESWFETVGIGIAILLATLVATLSEYGSEQTFKKLQKEAESIQCKVYRSGALTELPIQEIVVGDHVLLQSGDRVPADGAIIQGEIEVDQSPINGESAEVRKAARPGAGRSVLSLNDSAHVFRGCIATNGEAVMIVTQVGDKTLYGGIAGQVQEDTRESPLKVRLAHLAKTISVFGYISSGAVAIAYMFCAIFFNRGYTAANFLTYFTHTDVFLADLFQAVLLAVVIIVMAVPEGLPMMITVVLSSNMKRMLKDNLLVRKLVSIETSGSLNILFTDKTGTLTQGTLMVQAFVNGERRNFGSAESLHRDARFWDFLAFCILHNNEAVGSPPVGGNATDRALLSYMLQFSPPQAEAQVVSRIPFSSANKFASAMVRGRYNMTLVKGAPEKLLPHCTTYYDANLELKRLDKAALGQTLAALSRSALRLIAVATCESPVASEADFKNLSLVGVFCIRDAIRKNAAEGVLQVMSAGVQVVMMTGDSMDTAMAVAREAGLVSSGRDVALTSGELGAMTDSELSAILPHLRVVARAMPADKTRLVDIAQKKGMVAGMTGDGINDAPALKKADVGYAMGSGTEVAKEAGDIVILDNNLLSIANAILYGRTIFKSIRKFIIFQLTVNLCAVVISVVGPFIGVHMPVTVMQMLWINLVIDTLAGLAYGGEPPLKYYMKERPKRRDERIINKYMWSQIFFTGGYTAALCILFLKLPFFHGLFRGDAYYLTGFFTLFLFAGIFNSFSARTHRLNLLANLGQNRAFLVIMGLTSVLQIVFIYVGGTIFRTAGLTFGELVLTLALAFTVIPVDMLRKAIIRRMTGRVHST